MAEKGLTPAQKRAIRDAMHAEKAASRKARLIENLFPTSSKPRLGNAEPIENNTPRTSVNPESYRDARFTYSIEKKDCDGAWSWGAARDLLDSEWIGRIEPHLRQMQLLTWKEIENQKTVNKFKKQVSKNHAQDVQTFHNEAQTRWHELELSIHDVAFRFRLGNKPRLWGFRLGANFFVVWWDHLHQIYPVD